MISVRVLVNEECVAIVPLWMIHHVISDVTAHYPDQKFVLEFVL